MSIQPVWVCNISSKFAALLLCLALASCKPGLEEPGYTSGDADFSVVVAIGGSFTAGMSDSALSLEGQTFSYPALMAASFAKAGGGSFRQPLVNAGNGIGFDVLSNRFRGRTVLESYTTCRGGTDLRLKSLPFNASDFFWIGNQGPFNNMGVPGAKSFNMNSQIFGKSQVGNPFYYRIASDTGGGSGLSSTVLGDAELLAPTFFTVWIGINDVLAYAVTGGSPALSPDFEITPGNVFNTAIDTIIFSLASNGTDGLIGTVPDVTLFPFFNVMPYNGLVLTQAQADSLNLIAPPGISFRAGPNPLVVRNPGAGSIRQLREGEKVLLSASTDSIRCALLGTSTRPLSDRQVLDSSEVAAIRSAVAGYNAKIRNIAQLYSLAMADMNSYFVSLDSGIRFNGLDFSNQYLSGGFFSSDGIHPNARGYALIANEMLRAVNSRYRCNLPLTGFGSAAGVLYP